MKNEFNFQWHITNLCNLRCRHCYQEDFSSKSDLEWSEIKSIVDNIISSLKEKDLSTRIDLTGGEPFLKKELFLLLDYLSKLENVRGINIITNTTLINREISKRLKNYKKLKYIKVSLEGLDKISCSQIRGDSVFRDVRDSIELLKEDNFSIILMYTILKRNVEQISEILDFCYKYNLEGVILERFIPLGRGEEIKDEVLDRDDWKRVLELILSILPFKYDLDDLLPYRAFWIRLSKSLKLLGAKCNIGDTLCIMPNGNVFPCRRFNLPIGNLLKDSLKSILENSSLLKEIRDKNLLKGKCRICDIEDCIGCRAISYSLTGDCFSEDPQCWY